VVPAGYSAAGMKRRRFAPGAPLLALLVAAPASWAQLPQPQQNPPPTTQPAPAPVAKAGRASVFVKGGVRTRRLRYVIRGQRLLVTGRVKPFVAGQRVTVELRRRSKRVAHKRVRVRNRGRFSARLKARRRGTMRVLVKHAATARQEAFSAGGGRIKVVRWRAGKGAHGSKVLLLQRRLLSLGYAIPVTGSYDDGTARGVLAFRKVNRMSRTGYASPAVYRKAFVGRGRFKLRHPKAGKHVEFDWSRQVVVLADKGRAFRVYHASSGKPSTPTVFGSFRFYSKTPGTNAKGMVDSNYFIGGYAIHGYPEVPNYAASHGCIRVPIPNAAAIYSWIKLGDPMFAYG
jgi:L,D-transpeptidase-like protein/putative peptidoglycan binding protein